MCENCRAKHIVLHEKISWLNLHITNVRYLELNFIEFFSLRLRFNQNGISVIDILTTTAVVMRVTQNAKNVIFKVHFRFSL